MVSSGDQDTLAEAVNKFKTRLDLSPDLRLPVYKGYLKSGPGEASLRLETLTNLSCEVGSHVERARIYQSLGANDSKDIVQSVLDFAMSDKVKYQDTATILLAVAEGSKEGRDLTWKFFKERAGVFQERWEASISNSTLSAFNIDPLSHNPQSRQVVITIFTRVNRPSQLFNLTKQNTFQVK